MTFLESGKEYQSVRSYKGLNFRDGRLTFGVPLWHDLCSSSPNISGVNLSVCLWHCNSPSCLHAGGEAEKSSRNVFAFFFYRCRNETKARFNRLFSREKKKSSITNVTRSAEPHKRRINHRVKPEFALHFLCIGVSLVWTLRQKHAAEMKNVMYELENKISNMNYKSNRSPRRGWHSCLLQNQPDATHTGPSIRYRKTWAAGFHMEYSMPYSS